MHVFFILEMGAKINKRIIIVTGSVSTVYSVNISERCCRCPEGDIYPPTQLGDTQSVPEWIRKNSGPYVCHLLKKHNSFNLSETQF